MSEDSEQEGYYSELSSDEELQLDFAKGELKPGLITHAAPPRTYTNNVSGLREKLESIKKQELDWLERMDVTPAVAATTAARSDDPPTEGEDEAEGLDPNDDLKREMHFYQQAQSAVVIGLGKLQEHGIPTKRPEDYFAEMVKTDDHMRKVRESLFSRQKFLERKEKARQLRELKKYGKKVQQEVLKKRKVEKKTALEAVKKFRKGRGGRPDFLEKRGGDDDFPVSTEMESESRARKKDKKGKSTRRQMKDKKFGFGGMKRWRKSNTAESSADMRSFKSARNSKAPRKQIVPGSGGKKKGKAKRLGKSRRMKQKA